MKKYLLYIPAFFAVCIVLSFLYLFINPDIKAEEKKHEIECTVIDHVKTLGGRYGDGNLFLVLEDNKTGKVFDLMVAPKTYRHKDGTVLIFNLSKRQMTNKAGAVESNLAIVGIFAALAIISLVLYIGYML